MELSNNFNWVEIAGSFLGFMHFLFDQFIFTFKHTAKKLKSLEYSTNLRIELILIEVKIYFCGTFQ